MVVSLPLGGEADGAATNPPYALLGHSMGAWLVYEMAREIRRRRREEEGAPLAMPRKIFVCGNRAPHLGGPGNDPDTRSPAGRGGTEYA